MQNLTLENDFLNVNINVLGAELCSLFDKRDRIEHMWNASPAFWPRHAPILFPTVGESKDGKINVAGTDYPMGRHGFARFSEFEVVEQTESKAVFELRSNEDTRKHYPFEFIFRVGYELDGARLVQSFEVENSDGNDIGFQVGGHPAFAVPFRNGEKYDDYEIRFDAPQTLERHLLTEKGLYSGEKRKFLDNENSFGLFYELFNEDALVFRHIPSKRVWIQHKKGGKRLQVDYEGFPHLGIWSVPGANYVCIEPWIGCADMADQPADFFQKDSLVVLKSGETFNATFTILLIQEG
ncbi:MAG: aldose 1-epimerase family protein [Flavobacteriales bacterium]|nr:aldose 1-epimerase family protein [Flavobacteriales bacterium]